MLPGKEKGKTGRRGRQARKRDRQLQVAKTERNTGFIGVIGIWMMTSSRGNADG
jgi:hypothetical protein